MKTMLATMVFLTTFGITAHAAKDDGADYTLCQANAKEAFGSDVKVRAHKFKRKYIELLVIADDGRFVATCDRESFVVDRK